MYVSIALDPASKERAKELSELLTMYGFQKVQRSLWESMTVSEATLARLKRDIDKCTDGFDKLRFFQFPMEGTLVLSSLRDKKWRRMVAVSSENAKLGVVQKPVIQKTVIQKTVVQKPVVQKSVKR